jgi:hypothetical protein
MKSQSLLISGVVCAVTALMAIASPVTTKAATGNCGFDTTITQNTGQFSTPVSGATYQWMYCSTGMPIAGATGQTYTPPFGGSYAVAITLNGCTDTTDCLQSQSIIATGINNDKTELLLKVATVPNGSFLTITNNGAGINTIVTLMNTTGQTVLQQQLQIAAQQHLNTAGLPSGWYIVNIKSGDKDFTSRFFKSL